MIKLIEKKDKTHQKLIKKKQEKWIKIVKNG